MQQQMMRHEGSEEELKEGKVQLSAAERRRDCALDEPREIKRRTSSNERMTSSGVYSQELKMKEKTIESLRSQVEKDGSFCISNGELKSLKVSMAQMEDNLSDSKKRVQELEAEIEKRKITESKLFDSFEAQKRQLEEATASVDKYEHEVVSMQQKMQELEKKNQQNAEALREEIHKVGDESEDKLALVERIEVLKKELRQALDGEEYTKKALDGLVMALKEVTTESIQTKEQLKATQRELEVVKEDAESFKKLVKCTKTTWEAILSESAKEIDRLRNTVERQRLEAEESVLAWNEKEKEFVGCIKKVEAENSIVLDENYKLEKWAREAEEMSSVTKEENRKLRDVLKHALNEANVAKEVANLARYENYNLQDSLKEKDEALVSLAQETERLRINEAEATESIKELKRTLTMGSKRELSSKDGDECLEKDDSLGGSIFDKSIFDHVGKSSNLLNLEEVEQLDDTELDKNSQVKRKALLRRFGDLLKRKTTSSSHKDSTKDLPNQQKEIAV